MNITSFMMVNFLIILFSLCQIVLAGVHQKMLLKKLFENYDPTERPVQDDSKNMLVSVGLSIQQIVDIDEKTQTLVFSGWLDMSWSDYNLVWSPEEFGNISTIRVASSKIWIPDLLLFNSADDSFDPKSDVNAVIYSSGEVSYLPPGMFKSTCQIEIYEPFDEQKCELKFGSWTYDEDTVDLKNKSDSAQLDSYIINGEWDLEKVVSFSKSVKYECCPTRYPFVMFIMFLRRRTLYFIFNLVFPCVLISFMCILGFTLPVDSGEKIGLEITTLLSIMMFSQLITTIVPDSSLSIPKISLYFASVSVICTLSIFCNVAVLILHHRNVSIQGPMPDWVQKWICGYLAKALGMERPQAEPDDNSDNKRESANDLSSKSLLANVLDINDDFGVVGPVKSKENKIKSKLFNDQIVFFKRENSNYNQNQNCENCGDSAYSSSKGGGDSYPLKKNLHAILRELRVLTKKIKDDDEDGEKELNWKFAAMVIDRLCMWIFAFATFFSTTLILLTSKNFFKFK